MDHGMLDLVEHRERIGRMIERVLAHDHARAKASPTLPSTEGRPLIVAPTELEQRPAWELVQLARDIGRPTTLEYCGYVFDEFIEFHGDRLFGESSAIVGGPALLGELPVMVIGHQKGHTTADLVSRNFGMPQPEGYRKAMRLMQYAEKFGLPVVTFVDTPGAYPGIEAEERGQGVAIAQSIMDMSRLRVPIVTIVTGEGGSGGALALAVGDRVLMLENSFYSVISPEGCSTILWASAADAPRAAAALRVTARDLLELGIMDGIVPEPDGGAHLDAVTTAANVKTAVVSSLAELVDEPADALLERRYQRFRRFGTPGEQPVLSDPGPGGNA